MITLNAGGSTDVGAVRSENQDSYAILANSFVVADGMGGHLGGEVASTLATDTFISRLQDAETISANDLVQTVIDANTAIYNRGKSDQSVRGLGTTFTALATIIEDGENRIGIVHIGDSRAYVMRDGQLQQLTNDHSLVEELVRTGQLTPQEAEEHPKKNILTRALGIEEVIDPDVVQVLPFRGDRYLLCSDGLVRELTDDQIASILRRLANPKEASKELVVRARESGGADNITVVVVDVTETDIDETAIARSAVPFVSKNGPESTSPSQSESRSSSVANSSTDFTISPKSLPVARVAAKPLLTPRVIAFMFLFLLIIGASAMAVASYATRAYYVGLTSNDQLAVYKGRPGGVLWVKPKLVETRTVTLSEIPLTRQSQVKAGKVVGTRADANRYIENILSEASSFGRNSNSTTSLSTPSSVS